MYNVYYYHTVKPTCPLSNKTCLYSSMGACLFKYGGHCTCTCRYDKKFKAQGPCERGIFKMCPGFETQKKCAMRKEVIHVHMY